MIQQKKIRVLLLNGFLKDEDVSQRLQKIIEEEITEAGGHIHSVQLRSSFIAPCKGCFHCWIKTPGVCVIKDFGREVARMFVQSDLVVFLTPVTFGGYSSALKKALDRSICTVSPFFTKIDGEVHHKKRYDTYPNLLGIGVLPHSDPRQEEIFRSLLSRNALNMHNPVNRVRVSSRKQ